eukprot:TRINITY_DN66500_c0_g1_i1.p1 TRINITY_DN66500_c0_g1~~TRINITY_DN66500_c0_g1_i1.p1  ORF type:complete len:107 (+),score=13.47 TRINITY_DN66500_c0_g1_i1:166-486(+)
MHSSHSGNVLGRRAAGHSRGGLALDLLSPIQEEPSNGVECKTRDDDLLRQMRQMRQLKRAHLAKCAGRLERAKHARRVLRAMIPENESEAMHGDSRSCERPTKISL